MGGAWAVAVYVVLCLGVVFSMKNQQLPPALRTAADPPAQRQVRAGAAVAFVEHRPQAGQLALLQHAAPRRPPRRGGPALSADAASRRGTVAAASGRLRQDVRSRPVSASLVRHHGPAGGRVARTLLSARSRTGARTTARRSRRGPMRSRRSRRSSAPPPGSGSGSTAPRSCSTTSGRRSSPTWTFPPASGRTWSSRRSPGAASHACTGPTNSASPR